MSLKYEPSSEPLHISQPSTLNPEQAEGGHVQQLAEELKGALKPRVE